MSQKVVLLGADGFIGRHIAFALRLRGVEVRAVARRTGALQAMGFEAIQADLTDPLWHDAQAWVPLLRDGAHVVNAAGLLTGAEDAFAAVHVAAPRALYEAMQPDARGVLISATGIEGETDFSRWRRAGEEVAMGRLVILRPGLVMAETSFGGTSLARAMAAMPFAMPVVGRGEQPLNPIHAEDLADIVLHYLERPPERETLAEPIPVGGPQEVTQVAYLTGLRQWLGVRGTRVLRLPRAVARGIGVLGDVLRLGPVSATSVAQLETGVLAPPDARLATAPQPRGYDEILAGRPPGTQDLWHARLFLLRPVLRLTLAFMWLISGILGLVLPGASFLSYLSGVSNWVGLAAARLGGLVDIALAVALARNWRPEITGPVQLGVVGAYTIGLTVMAPALWMLPFGGILKNLPVLALILVWMVLERER